MEGLVKKFSDIFRGKNPRVEAKVAAFEDEQRQVGMEPLPKDQLAGFAKKEIAAQPSVKDSYLKD